MSGWRSILLHLDAAERSSARLTLARELARHHHAQLTAMYAVTPAMFEVPFDFAGASAGAIESLYQLDVDRRDAARARFDRACSGAAPTPHWLESTGEAPVPAFVARALCSDLVVLGQQDVEEPGEAALPGGFNPSVLLASGRPALIVPAHGDCDARVRRVLVGWKATCEAAHAVTAALPLLTGAAEVHVVSGVPAGHASDAEDLEAWMRLHRIEASIVRHGPVAEDDAGAGLLSFAAEVGADVLVMGCYGHGRAREWVLGGASRSVLRGMTLPVLMAH